MVERRLSQDQREAISRIFGEGLRRSANSFVEGQKSAGTPAWEAWEVVHVELLLLAAKMVVDAGRDRDSFVLECVRAFDAVIEAKQR